MPTNCPSVRWLLGAAVLAGGCGGGGGGGGGGGPGRTLAISAGNNQIGNAGAALGTPLAVVVREVSTSNPVQGVTINWALGLGGGLVTASSVTDASGIATAARTLGADSVVQTTTASGSGLSGSPVTFNATSRIQGATQIQLNAGNTQSDTIGATLAYAVLVRDETSTPVAGVTVNWSAAGGGSVSAPTSVTDGSGIATVNRILGTTAGAQTAQARVTGLNGNPVSFTATATAGGPTSIEKTAEPATGVINSNVTYTVTARDRANNPKSGVTIDWAVTGGGGSIAPLQNTTGANGQASAMRTLSGTAGPHTATAAADTISDTLTFATNATTAPLAENVTVSNNFFNPAAATIASTGTVTWNWNSGGVLHNVTFEDNVNNSTTKGTGSHSRTFPAPATFRYRCTIHSSDFDAGMVGTVTVQ